MPEIYRLTDAENGNMLEKYSEGLRPSFDLLRHKIQGLDLLRDPSFVQAKDPRPTLIRLGEQVQRVGPILQIGIDGSVTSLQEFKAVTARFQQTDRGRSLTVSRSLLGGNNRSVRITNVISRTTVLTDPPLRVDAGPLRWEVRDAIVAATDEVTVTAFGDVSQVAPGWILDDGRHTYEVRKRLLYPGNPAERQLVSEREGTTGFFHDAIFGTSFRQYGIRLTKADIGKHLVVFNSPETFNNASYEIQDVLNTGYSDTTDAVLCRTFFWDATPGAPVATKLAYTMLPGVTGVRIRHVHTGPLQPLLVAVSGRDITVQYATDVNGVVTSTAPGMQAAIAANAQAAALISTGLLTYNGDPFRHDTGGFVALKGRSAFPQTPLISPPNVGDLHWALLPAPELTLVSTGVPDGLIERRGSHINVSQEWAGPFTPTQVRLTGDLFSSLDVGKFITLYGSITGNDGTFQIADVPAAYAGARASLVDTVHLSFEDFGPTFFMSWDLRKATAAGDLTEVSLSPPPLLNLLAQDFGIEVDNVETETRQRSWVRNVSQWLALKGSSKGYSVVGDISGYDVRASQLYRVTRDMAGLIPADHLFIIGEEGVGRFGSLGRLDRLGNYFLGSAEGRFRAPTGSRFHAGDVGSYVRVENASNPANDRLFEIAEVLSPTTIIMQWPDIPDQTGLYGREGMSILYPGGVTYIAEPDPAIHTREQLTSVPAVPIRIRHLQDPPGSLITVSVAGTDITVSFPTGTTNLAVAAAVRASPVAAALVRAGALGGAAGFGSFVPIFGVDWSVVRLYTDLPPEFMHLDDFNVDRVLIAFPGFTPDTPCWAQGLIIGTAPSVLSISAVISLNPLIHLVRFPAASDISILPSIPADLPVGTPIGAVWKLTDLAGSVSYLETTPALVGGFYESQVISSVVPVIGPATLEYICPALDTGDYTGVAVARVTIEATTVLDEENVDLDRNIDRILERLAAVTPAHVRLVPVLIQNLTASFNLSASVDASVTVIEDLYAPFTVYHDDVPADDPLYPLDTGIVANTEEFVISSVSPSSGPAAGGTAVTISGLGFNAAATAAIGGLGLGGLVVVDSTTITGTTVAHAPGAVDVEVTNPGPAVATLVGAFTYV